MTTITRSNPNKFISLSDTPSSYTGMDGRFLMVDEATLSIVFTTLSALSNFSYRIVVAPLTVPVNQQMITYKDIDIQDELTLNGDLVLID